MSLLNSKTAENAHDLIDARVVDQTGEEIGTVHALWADHETGNLQFLGVKTGWLFGQSHIIPAEAVEMDDASGALRVPYTADKVKGALSIDAEAEISDSQESEIYRYYGVGGRTASYSESTTREDTLSTSGQADYRASGTTAATGGTAASLTDTAEAAAARATGETHHATATDKDSIEVPLTEEEVKVGKRTVSAGQVRLRKIVRTEIVNQPVEVRREDVVIERVSADQVHTGTATSDFKEEVIDVPLSREEVVVSKEAHITGAVRVNKTSMAETQNVSETVRKEDVEVLRDGETVREEGDLRK